MRRRGRLADEKLTLLRQLLKGEPVAADGRRIHITPACTSPGGPFLMLAGGSAAAVKRAAKHGLGAVLQTNQGGLKELYENECRAHGHEPGFVQLPADNAPTAVFVADDVDKAWDELGPYVVHDAVTAASYRHGDEGVASISRATDVSGLQRPTARIASSPPTRQSTTCVAGGSAACAAVWWGAAGRGVAVPGASRRSRSSRRLIEGESWRQIQVALLCGRPGVSAPLRSRGTSTPDLELVGVWVHSQDKVGRDAGELAGGEPIGVEATNDADALIALRPDCVVYAASGPGATPARSRITCGCSRPESTWCQRRRPA